jgi:hypothetical protein
MSSRGSNTEVGGWIPPVGRKRGPCGPKGRQDVQPRVKGASLRATGTLGRRDKIFGPVGPAHPPTSPVQHLWRPFRTRTNFYHLTQGSGRARTRSLHPGLDISSALRASNGFPSGRSVGPRSPSPGRRALVFERPGALGNDAGSRPVGGRSRASSPKREISATVCAARFRPFPGRCARGWRPRSRSRTSRDRGSGRGKTRGRSR